MLPALVTPFDADGEIDLESHAHNTATLAAHGVGGFLIGGSTGEGPTLETGERARLCETARQEVPDTFLMVGIVAESVRQALHQIEEVSSLGQAALVLPPVTLARNSEAAQTRFFLEVAERSPLPILLYSVPRNTGYPLAESIVRTVSMHQNIIGMKDSGGDAARIAQLVADTPGDFVLFNGASRSIGLALTGGAHGAITASINYLRDGIRLLIDRTKAGTDVRILQASITRVTGFVEGPGIGGVKAAAEIDGLRPGAVRPPLGEVDDDFRVMAKALLTDFAAGIK